MKKRDGGTLVIESHSGMGDVIWHLPYLRAIARVEGPVTFLTKSATKAKEWLGIDPAIKEILYVDHGWKNFILPTLIKRHFQKSWVLHHSFSYATLPYLASIPERHGYGFGRQKYLLTSSPYLPSHMRRDHNLVKLKNFFNMIDQGKAYYLDPEDQVPPLCKQAHQELIKRFSALPRPWLCMGIGSADENRRWPLPHFATLITYLDKEKIGTIFLCGSKAEQKDAHEIINLAPNLKNVKIQEAMGLPLLQAFALMKEADLYVGNDTSLLNIAGSFGTTTLGFFGGSIPLTYTPSIYALQPPQGTAVGKPGMAAILPSNVLNYLKEHQHV